MTVREAIELHSRPCAKLPSLSKLSTNAASADAMDVESDSEEEETGPPKYEPSKMWKEFLKAREAVRRAKERSDEIRKKNAERAVREAELAREMQLAREREMQRARERARAERVRERRGRGASMPDAYELERELDQLEQM